MSVLTFGSVSVDYIVVKRHRRSKTNVCDPSVNVVLQNVVEELYTGLWDSIAVNSCRGGVDAGDQDSRSGR